MLATLLESPYLPIALLMLAIVAFLPLVVGYLVHLERKVLADMQMRLGPMRVGPHGLLQPLADALKLLLKEDIVPARADKFLFYLAPVLTVFCALTALSVVPFSPTLRIADVNVGVLVVLAFASIGVLGIVLGGWASHSNYPLMGALRSTAQLVSYEVALSLALLCGIMKAGSLSMVAIVEAQRSQQVWFALSNYGFMFLAFWIFLIAATAETNRAPFDLPEAESELVAGFHTEYSGFRWALFMLSEYINVLVVSSLAVTLFWGGWLAPFPSVSWLRYPLEVVVPALLFAGVGLASLRLLPGVPLAWQRAVLVGFCGGLLLFGALFFWPAFAAVATGPFWFISKVGAMLYLMIWFRGTFPRYRYDQLMTIGWKYLIPLGMGILAVNAVVGML